MTIEKKIVVFNGPIECGKDTIVDRLVTEMPFLSRKMEMKTKLIELTQSIYGVSHEWWTENYTRAGKDIPRPELGGRSMREALIHTSEVVIKPNYGKDYFGKMSKKLIDQSEDIWYFYADGGFPEELTPIGSGVTPLLIRIHRDGYYFNPEEDSRDYVKDEDLPANWKVVDIENENGKFDEFCYKVVMELNKLAGCHGKDIHKDLYDIVGNYHDIHMRHQ